MKMSLKNSMNQQKVDDELKKLALEYIKAHGSGDLTGAELILHDLNKLKELTNAKDTKES